MIGVVSGCLASDLEKIKAEGYCPGDNIHSQGLGMIG